MRTTGFWGFVSGILLCALAIFVAVFGIIVLLGFLNSFVSDYNIPLGIIMLIMALFMFAYGWYSYKSSKPKGTLNVHNV